MMYATVAENVEVADIMDGLVDAMCCPVVGSRVSCVWTTATARGAGVGLGRGVGLGVGVGRGTELR